MIAQGHKARAACQRRFLDGRLTAMSREPRFEESALERPWAVLTCGRLLLLEGIGLLALAWLMAPDGASPTFEEAWLPGLLALMGLFGLLTGANMLQRRRAARDQAMLLQGAALLLGLVLYWGERPGFVYELLGVALFFVLYLQHSDVRASFPDGGYTEDAATKPRVD
jgi:hypothetical protein